MRSMKYWAGRFSVLLLATMIWAGQVGSASAATHALVIGIDKYVYGGSLRGAVNDARDIARALRASGVESLTVLLNEEATRERIGKSWIDLLVTAERGDTIIFTYAGHGAQEPEHVPGSEADGKDETFLLGGFDPRTRKGLVERIVDNVINVWLKEATRRGLRVIFVADSCHSGTMHRSVDPRATALVRSAPPYSLPADMSISDEITAGAGLTVDDLPGVTFLAATQEHRKSPEVAIDGKFQGALSWSFARAIEAKADRDGDGITTGQELKSYIVPMVRMLSEARQTPDIQPRGIGKRQVLASSPSAEDVPSADQVSDLHLSILNLDEETASEIVDRLDGVTFAGSGEAADLIWDASDKAVLNATGDVVAHDIEKQTLQGVADKWRAIVQLKTLAKHNPLGIRVFPSDAQHQEGQKVRFESDPVSYPHLTVFNLASDGEVQFLYPEVTDPESWPIGQAYQLPLEVCGPFGADHLVIISSKERLANLHRRLRRSLAHELPSLIRDALQETPYQLGVQGLFTCPAGAL